MNARGTQHETAPAGDSRAPDRSRRGTVGSDVADYPDRRRVIDGDGNTDSRPVIDGDGDANRRLVADGGETGPHQGPPVETAGADPADAVAGAVLVHGRGANARSVLSLASEFDHDEVAYLAPQARRGSWYPNSFLAPVQSNEPGRTSGLRAVGDAVERLVEAGIPRERVLLGGFSQGACLASEFLARNPERYGGLAAFSGGVIGEEIDVEEYEGSVEGTPVFIGCSDVDPHIPLERVEGTAAVFERLEADVDERIYEGMGHTINQDEIDAVDAILADIVASGSE